MFSWFDPLNVVFRANFVPYPMRLNARDFLSHIWNIEIFVLWKEGPEKPSQQMTYFDQIDPINDTFDQIYVHKPDWNNFWYRLLRKNFFVPPQNFDVCRHFGPENDPILIIFNKWPILTK